MRKKTAAALCAVLSMGLAHADWQYETIRDPMTDKQARIASLESNLSLRLEAPYGGRNMASLIVRQHPRHGLDAIFRVDKGQIMCRSYDDGCALQIKFDSGNPIRFSGLEAADHDPRVVFIRDAKRFVAAAGKAKRILLQANFFHNGSPIIEFHSSAPLAWADEKPPAAKKPMASKAASAGSGKSADECRAEVAGLPAEAQQAAVIDCLLTPAPKGR